jgi:hypothetical protein
MSFDHRERNPLHSAYLHDTFRSRRGIKMVRAWASGKSYVEIAGGRFTVDEVRDIIRYHIEYLFKAHTKWRLAQIKCHALGIELRALRSGKDCPDRPIEALNPPAVWLRVFRKAGIETVNQLRAVDEAFLLGKQQFPRAALHWACMKLDRLKLSHALISPPKPKPIVFIAKLVRRPKRKKA